MAVSELVSGPRRALALFALITLLVAAGVVAAILLTRAHLQAVPPQPIAYSHRTHVEAGIECLYCHSQAVRSPIAGLPSLEKCMSCHTVIASEKESVQELAGYWERGEPIRWAKVNDQPDFVYFSHRPHLAKGLNCETCHGEVGTMNEAEPSGRMDMGWCLECHTQQDPEHVERLVDCQACHK